MQKLYTTEAIAELLHVSTRTILRERHAGRIGFKRIRGRIRFTQEDVELYLKKQALVSSGSLGRDSESNPRIHMFRRR